MFPLKLASLGIHTHTERDIHIRVCLGFHPFGVSGVRDRKLPHTNTHGAIRRRDRESGEKNMFRRFQSGLPSCVTILVTRAFRRLARGGGNKKTQKQKNKNKKQKKLANNKTMENRANPCSLV